MRTISLKPAGAALNLRGILTAVKSFIKVHHLPVAISSALICFGAIYFGSLLISAIAGTIALTIAGTYNCQDEKGGER